MRRIFLAPRSGEKSYKNFLSTIKHGVPYDRIEPHLNSEGREILSKEEIIYAWGNREGRSAPWHRMENGDLVIFYANKNFVMAGEVIFKQRSKEMALAMWPPDEKGNPWEYTFFINNLRFFKIPLKYFNSITGYEFTALMGFQEVSAEYKKELFSHYKDLNDLFDEFSDDDSQEKLKDYDKAYFNVSKEIKPNIVNKDVTRHEPDVEPSSSKKERAGYIDFEEKHKSNVKIGNLGEEIVKKMEVDYLTSINRADLAKKVYRISMENTFAGFDIVSFDENGNEKKIEVKSTTRKMGKSFSFNISKNEIETAKNSPNYYIYLVFDVKSKSPDIQIIPSPLSDEKILSIEPSQFIAKGKFI